VVLDEGYEVLMGLFGFGVLLVVGQRLLLVQGGLCGQFRFKRELLLLEL
jgi:hypothetical protein